MERGSGYAAGRLSALVEEIEAEAYARGKADARTEILSVLTAAGEPVRKPRRGEPQAARPAHKPRAGGGKRAPKGTVRALVERALRDRPGLSSAEILNRADSAAERLVKLSSIRVELHTGRRQGRYETADGRWSLVASPAEVDGAPDPEASPEPDGTAGASSDAPQSEAGPSPEPDEAAGAPAGDTLAGRIPGEDATSRDPETAGDQGKLGMNW